MPHLEAPIGFGESSPDNSFSHELPGPTPMFGPGDRNHIPPAVVVQLRAPSPEQRDQGRAVEDVVRPQPPRRRPLQRLNSFDRDIATLEEENHWRVPYPPFVHLLPVNLPPQVTEPPLDELLRRVTERTDLHNVEAVRLRVISYQISLSRLALFLPRLQHLDLSGSVLSSLRDLGCGLVQLSHLNVSNCGLGSFDGTSGLPAIRELIADGNMIQRVGPLAELPLLRRLSARHNRISDLGLLTFLGMCPNLVELELQGNPVCHLSLYRLTLQRSVSSLQMLDGAPLHGTSTTDIANLIIGADPQPTQRQHTAATDSELSSLSSEVCSEPNVDASDAFAQPSNSQQRPFTAPNGSSDNDSSLPRRPFSAVNRRDSLSFGEPVVGSVVSLVRRNQRNCQRRSHAWISSSSSSASHSSSNASTRPSSVSSNGSGSYELPPLQTRLPRN